MAELVSTRAESRQVANRHEDSVHRHRFPGLYEALKTSRATKRHRWHPRRPSFEVVRRDPESRMASQNLGDSTTKTSGSLPDVVFKLRIIFYFGKMRLNDWVGGQQFCSTDGRQRSARWSKVLFQSKAMINRLWHAHTGCVKRYSRKSP